MSGIGPKVALFALAFLTMVVAGATFEIGGNVADVWKAPELLVPGLPYAAALMSILLVREAAHYLVTRHHRLRWTPPWFVPVPNLFGTLGAISVLSEPPKSRRALFDMAVAGPLAGLAVTLPLLALGLYLSDTLDSPQIASPSFGFGQPLLFQWMMLAVKPEAVENGAAWHPLAFAGWTGLLTTAIVLLPLGQLDGGHAAYAMLGRRQSFLASGTLAALVGIGLAQQSPLWIIWVLVMLLIGHRHPPLAPEAAAERLGPGRIALACALVVVLVLCFSVQPTGGWVHRS